MLKAVNLRPAEHAADYDTCMGMLALLGATTSFGSLPLTRAVGVLHCALKTGNFRIYLGSNNRPSAAVVWAYLSDEVSETYVKNGYLVDIADWTSGKQLWFPHVIAEGGKAKFIIEDMVSDPMFRDFDCGYMLRASANGKRRVVAVTRTGVKLVRTLEG